jgi:hypothetical protein
MADSDRTYSPEAVQEILHLAIVRQADEGENTQLSYSQLVEIAGDLNIDLATLQGAETEWRNNFNSNIRRVEFDRARWGRLQGKLGKFAIINGCLFAINWFSGAGVLSWSIYVALIWGSTLALSAWKTYSLQGEAYDRKFGAWQRQRQLKQSVSKAIERFLPV